LFSVVDFSSRLTRSTNTHQALADQFFFFFFSIVVLIKALTAVCIRLSLFAIALCTGQGFDFVSTNIYSQKRKATKSSVF
jgi:hypothetical protein